MSLHRADEELRVSEAQTRAILDASLDCIIMMDAAGRVVEFNPAAERTFGWTREQVLGGVLGELIVPPSLRGAHRSGLERYLQTGSSGYLGRRVETTAVRADGSEFPIELTIVRIETTGSAMFTGTLRDISDRRALERDLRARVEELARERGLTDVISDTVASMICVIESDGTHVKNGVNLPFERGMGLQDGDLANRRFPDTLIAREDAAAARALLDRVRAGQPPGEIESAWITSDGERRRVSWTCAPIVDWRGRDALLVSGLDVTARRASESQLERFFELSSDLLATANAEGRFTRVNPAFERTLGYCAARAARRAVHGVRPSRRPRGDDDRARQARARLADAALREPLPPARRQLLLARVEHDARPRPRVGPALRRRTRRDRGQAGRGAAAPARARAGRPAARGDARCALARAGGHLRTRQRGVRAAARRAALHARALRAGLDDDVRRRPLERARDDHDPGRRARPGRRGHRHRAAAARGLRRACGRLRPASRASSRPGCARPACARPWRRRSTSPAASGVPPSRRARSTRRSPRAPSCACRTSPTWSRRRSATRRRTSSWPPRASASCRPATASASASSATSTTAPSSAW